MSDYLGDFVGTETVYHHFTTVQSTGAGFTLAGTPKFRCYKAGGTTESSDITPTVDFDSRTGLVLVAVDLTGDSGFYTSGNDYSIVCTAGTVNSVSFVAYVVARFSILNRSALRPATAGRTLVVDAAGLADANMVKAGPTGSGTAQTARDLGASVLLSSGTGTGQLDFTSGVVKANLAQILGTALTETAGLLAGGFKKFFNIATPASTMDALTLVATATNVTTVNGLAANVITATSINADAITAAKIADGAIDAATFAAGAINAAAIAADAITDAKVASDVTIASVTGAVGSVTGAVGSVTGAVGSVTGAVGSVTGAVGSVTGAVGSVTGNVGGNLLGTLSTTERAAIADALLDRDMSTGTDSGSTTVRTVRQALRALRNKWSIAAGTLTVTKENDSTTSWTASVTTSAGDPVSTIDPAGP